MKESVQPEDRATRWLASLTRKPGFEGDWDEVTGSGRGWVEETLSHWQTTAKLKTSQGRGRVWG